MLKLEPVPKIIKPLVAHWCPQAFIVSFKLETDPRILLEKARQALTKYEHNVVIANLLTERKRKVTIVQADQEDYVIECHSGEIEQLIVDHLLELCNKRRSK